MSDLISRQAALDIIDSELNGWLADDERLYLHLEGVGIRIECLPTIDPVKHGKWIYNDEAYPGGNPYGHYECAICGEWVPHRTNYCPNCGAQMEIE